MTVQSLFYSDKDGMEKALKNPEELMFTSKAEADKRDRMLEFSECLMDFLNRRVEGIPEEKLEEITIEIAKNQDLIKKGFKNPTVLLESSE